MGYKLDKKVKAYLGYFFVSAVFLSGCFHLWIVYYSILNLDIFWASYILIGLIYA